MGNTKIIFSSILCLITVIFYNPGYAAEIYISLSGNDQNPGTIEKPLATFRGAQTKLREIREEVTVYVRGGNYYFTQPLLFDSLDARLPNEKIIFKPYNGEEVIISGAQLINPVWEKHLSNIYKAKVSKDKLFDQIFIDGKKLRMARFPDYDPKSSHFGGYSEEVLSDKKVKSWKNPKGAYIHALHKHEWGGFHYQITGKDAKGKLTWEGGYQNNRQLGMHDKYRFIENVYEELDAEGEWFYDKDMELLYIYSIDPTLLANAEVLSPQIKSLIEFRGSATNPVANIRIEGFAFRHLLRTFMETKEPLLRSDWTIYRGGAIVLEGTENIKIINCHFKDLGGNAVFFSKYNRAGEVSSCHIEQIGANGICIVGDPNAVRSPSFEYNEAIAYNDLDKTPGPKTINYPSECVIQDNLIHDIGEIEKQVAGVQLSMAMDISILHNTIYNVPRAGINIGDGTWGGHRLAYNDVFNTVLESGDHGAFNSWGRDRFWHPDRTTMDSLTLHYPELISLDAQKTILIHNNRFRCDHGWDIDLDDGSSNYHIYNNLCLNGGIKLREGFNRKVENNIVVNNSFHPHVWFKNSGDSFRHNILFQPYYPIRISDWRNQIDNNLFLTEKGLEESKKNRNDQNSISGNPLFVNAKAGDFRVSDASPAKSIGFKNFDMDNFGVYSESLRNKALKVPLPALQSSTVNKEGEAIKWLGMHIRNVTGLGDRSAYGLPDESGVIILEIEEKSIFANSSIKNGDVIRKMHDKVVVNYDDLLRIFQEVNWMGTTSVEIIRMQKTLNIKVSLK